MHCSIAIDVISFPRGTEGSPIMPTVWRVMVKVGRNAACAREMKVKVCSQFMLTQENHFSGTEQQLVEMQIQHFFLLVYCTEWPLIYHAPCGETYAKRCEKHSFFTKMINEHCFAQSTLAQIVLGHGKQGMWKVSFPGLIIEMNSNKSPKSNGIFLF